MRVFDHYALDNFLGNSRVFVQRLFVDFPRRFRDALFPCLRRDNFEFLYQRCNSKTECVERLRSVKSEACRFIVPCYVFTKEADRYFELFASLAWAEDQLVTQGERTKKVISLMRQELNNSNNII